MSIQITIDSPGLAKVIQSLEKSPKEVRSRLHRAIDKGAILIEREAKLEAPVGVSGNLRSRIRTTVGDLQAIISPQVEYAVYVHEGTRPHGVSRKGQEQLRRWCERKGVPFGAVLTSIRRRGTRANPFMVRGAENATPAVTDAFNEEVDYIARFIVQ